MVQEHPSRIGRRLSAKVSADVAGYSRLMGLDETGAARILREHRAVSDALVANMAAVSSGPRETARRLSFPRRAAGTFFV
jgi:hypothetical protein